MGVKIDLDEVYAAQRAVEEARGQIRQQIAQLQEREAEIEAELSDYETTIRMLEQLSPRLVFKAETITPDEADEDGGLPRGALRQYIETTLHTFAREGASVGAIRDHIRQRYRVEVQPNTVSVTLNRLKARGVARLEGQDWSPANVTHAGALEVPQWLRDAPDPEPPVNRGGDLDDDIPF